MTIPLKSQQDIKKIKAGGEKLSSVLTALVAATKAGTNVLDIEKKAVQLIKLKGGVPGFMKVPYYKWATCININEGIVHGVPRNYVIKLGDVVSIDIGMYYQGFHTDMCYTFQVKNPKSSINSKKNKEAAKFLAAGKLALKEAIKQAKPGNRVGNISQKINEVISGAGYNVALNLTGHGVGKKLHEPPAIPCFLIKPIKETPLLKPGMVLAIEIIYCQGKPDLIIDQIDGWTIKTKDGKISAVFEETIALLSDGSLVLTKLPKN